MVHERHNSSYHILHTSEYVQSITIKSVCIKYPHYTVYYSTRVGLHPEYPYLEPCGPCYRIHAMRGQYSKGKHQIKQKHSPLCTCQGAETAKTTTGRGEVNTTKDTSKKNLTVTQLMAKIKKLQWAIISFCVSTGSGMSS